MAEHPQSRTNHVRVVPGFHYGVLGAFVLNLLWSLYRLYRTPGLDAAMGLVLAVALLGLVLYVRMFPLRVQDRVIRLEMRLRLAEVLPPELRPRIAELRPRQLVALRFAGDAELPALVRQVLDGQLTDARAIKERIRDWQADHLRA
jgi:Family of unknown function (DUF6526)